MVDKTGKVDDFQAEIDKVDNLKIGDKIRFDGKDLLVSDIEVVNLNIAEYGGKKEMVAFSTYILADENGEIYKKAKQIDLINKIKITGKASLKVEDAFLIAETEEIQEQKPPKPLVFEKFNDIEKELDFSKYNSGDIIGYDLKGSKYSVSKIDSLIFINTDTAITPWGEVVGWVFTF